VPQASGNFSDVKSLRLIFSSADLTEMATGIVKFTAFEGFPELQGPLHYEIEPTFIIAHARSDGREAEIPTNNS
jgi:hypothetical protein